MINKTQLSFKLFSTTHCHLCELAISLLKEQGIFEQTSIIEIAEALILLEQYGTHIPVLQRLDNLAELSWPFSKRELDVFVSK